MNAHVIDYYWAWCHYFAGQGDYYRQWLYYTRAKREESSEWKAR